MSVMLNPRSSHHLRPPIHKLRSQISSELAAPSKLFNLGRTGRGIFFLNFFTFWRKSRWQIKKNLRKGGEIRKTGESSWWKELWSRTVRFQGTYSRNGKDPRHVVNLFQCLLMFLADRLASVHTHVHAYARESLVVPSKYQSKRDGWIQGNLSFQAPSCFSLVFHSYNFSTKKSTFIQI